MGLRSLGATRRANARPRSSRDTVRAAVMCSDALALLNVVAPSIKMQVHPAALPTRPPRPRAPESSYPASNANSSA